MENREIEIYWLAKRVKGRVIPGQFNLRYILIYGTWRKASIGIANWSGFKRHNIIRRKEVWTDSVLFRSWLGLCFLFLFPDIYWCWLFRLLMTPNFQLESFPFDLFFYVVIYWPTLRISYYLILLFRSESGLNYIIDRKSSGTKNYW